MSRWNKPADQPYSTRRADAIVLNFTMDEEAVRKLRKYVPKGMRNTGAFLARLIYEHDARMEERQRLLQAASAPEEVPTSV
jgi:hypothetical protein